MALPGAEQPCLLVPDTTAWASDIPSDTPGRWLAVIPGRGTTDRVAWANVRVRPDPHDAHPDPDLARVELRITCPHGAPGWLVRHVPGVRPGRVRRLALVNDLREHRPLSVRYPAGAAPWRATLRLQHAAGKEPSQQAIMVVEQGTRSMSLESCPLWSDTGQRSPISLWVGDLDGDGSVDVLMSYGEDGSRSTLWMGSTHPQAPLLRCLATFEQSGC